MSYSSLFKFGHLSFGLVATLALIGIGLSLRLWRRCLLLYLTIFSLMASCVIIFISARYRLSIIPFLIIFASFSLYWWFKKIKEKKVGFLFLSIFLLPPSWALIYNNTLYTFLHPEGRQIQSGKTTIVSDYSERMWHGEKKTISSSCDKLKKELVLPDGYEKSKEVLLWFQFTTGPNPGVISVTVNDGKEIIVQPPPFNEGFPGHASLHFKPDSFRKGINTIIFGVPHVADINLCVDQFYTFKRSYFLSKQGRWERLKKGEFIVHLAFDS
jgi:hypothetical protein